MIKYFHELTEEEFYSLPKAMTWAECARDYPQPEWCGYPEAVCGVMGCWLLMEYGVRDRRSCVRCECYIKRKKGGK